MKEHKLYFFTNNLIESFNRTINSFYITSKKNFYNLYK